MTEQPTNNNRILVIKLGALGDMMQAMGAMQAIRRHHGNAHITFLTTKPFAKMGADCGYFDAVKLDERPKWHQPACWMSLRSWFQDNKFTRVYDLQNNDRTALYLKMLKTTGAHVPEWVGAAPGASHRNTSKTRTQSTAFAGHVETLALAGITGITIDRLEWMQDDLTQLGLQKPFAVLVPGSSPQHPQKRWEVSRFIAVADDLQKRGIQPVLIGTKDEAKVTATIAAAVPQCLDLTGKTSLYSLAALGREAVLAIGNDTGPMHLVGASGCACISLFCTAYSNPKKHAPLGENVTVLARDALGDITVADVIAVLENLLQDKPAKRA